MFKKRQSIPGGHFEFIRRTETDNAIAKTNDHDKTYKVESCLLIRLCNTVIQNVLRNDKK